VATSRSQHLQIVGLREFARACKRADVEAAGHLRGALKRAAEKVKDTTVSLMEQQFVSGRSTGALQRSVRASSGTQSATIRAGKGSVPYAGWWEFGGRGPNNRPSRREFVKRGRSIYPAVEQNDTEIVADLEAVLQRLSTVLEQG
jgi:hypothetical protein